MMDIIHTDQLNVYCWKWSECGIFLHSLAKSSTGALRGVHHPWIHVCKWNR